VAPRRCPAGGGGTTAQHPATRPKIATTRRRPHIGPCRHPRREGTSVLAPRGRSTGRPRRSTSIRSRKSGAHIRSATPHCLRSPARSTRDTAASSRRSVRGSSAPRTPSGRCDLQSQGRWRSSSPAMLARVKYWTCVGMTDHQRAPSRGRDGCRRREASARPRPRARAARRCGRAHRPGRGRCSITSPMTTAWNACPGSGSRRGRPVRTSRPSRSRAYRGGEGTRPHDPTGSHRARRLVRCARCGHMQLARLPQRRRPGEATPTRRLTTDVEESRAARDRAAASSRVSCGPPRRVGSTFGLLGRASLHRRARAMSSAWEAVGCVDRVPLASS